MKKDFIITFINYAFVFVCGVLLYKLAASGFGPVGFGEYALSKRAVSFLQPILQMGLSVGLVRYIAIAPGGPEGAARRASYVVSGFACITLFSLVLLGVLNLVPGAFGKLVFGGPGYVSYVRLVSLLAAASIVNLLAFTYYRGKGSFVAANALMALAQGLLPLLSVAFARSPGQALALNAAGVFAVSAAFLAPALAESLPKMSLADLVPSLRELLRYGTARVPGDLSMAAMLALPAFLTANMYGVKEAGYVAFGVTLVNITGAMFGPIGFIMLPRLSSFLS
ncbi:MAG TPA: hypothetical protein VJM83_05910, partial [Nitrospirota bacterium]|nr:hypothetical protein [Nitrospirota bacterium]